MSAEQHDPVWSFIERARDFTAVSFGRNYGPFFLSLLAVAATLGAAAATVITELAEARAAAQGVSDLLNHELAPPRKADRSAVAVAAIQLLREAIATDKRKPFETKLRDFTARIQMELRAQVPHVEPIANQTLENCNYARKSMTFAMYPLVYVPEQLAQLYRTGLDAAPKSPNLITRANYVTVLSDDEIQVLSGVPVATGDLAEQEARLAAGWSIVLPTIASILQNEDYRVIHVYYVTAHGALASWTSTLKPACDVYANDDGYSLAERPYMIELRDKFSGGDRSPESTADLYIDAGGEGIVGTTCVADIDYRSQRFAGAACVDYQPILKSALVADRSARIKVGLFEGTFDSPRNDAITLAEKTNVDCYPVLASSDSERLQHSNDGICYVPVSTDHDLWLKISYRQPRHAPLGWSLLLASCASLLLFYMVRRTSNWRAAEARLFLIRDLPAGVLQVRRGLETRGEILAANDRAEDLLECSLPSFTEDWAGKRSLNYRDFWDLFEKAGFELKVRRPSGSDSLVADEESAKTETAEYTTDIGAAVVAKRKQGISSKYWVQLKGASKKWLEISGTPEFGLNPPNTMSFSLVVEADLKAVKLAQSQSARSDTTGRRSE